MLLKIKGPKSYFWQWDIDRQLIVGEDTCGEVHFCNGTTDRAPVCEIYEKDGQRLVNVPNIFLQTAKPLTAYLYRKGSDGSLTRHQQTFSVVARNKPDGYVYTETEVKTWAALEDRVKALEESGGVGGVAVEKAEVGQIIMVKAVDENDKPTEWEAVKRIGVPGGSPLCSEVFNDYETNKANGAYTHAEGSGTFVQSSYGHVEGWNTDVRSDCGHAQGRYNVVDTAKRYAHIVGNGTYLGRSNAHTVDWKGNGWFAGDVYVGGENQDEGERLAKVSEIPEIPKDMFTATASEGQLFRVKSVDENGKPTELEPFDLFNAPEAVEIVPGVTLPLDDDGGAVFTEEVPALTLGATYLVMLNGEQYICVAKPVEMDGETLGLGLGNIGDFTGGENTGEPFVVVRVADELVAAVGFRAFIWALGVESPITFSIVGIDMKIKDAFLPTSAGAEIPTTLPNPHKLTFSGAVNAEYDGSEAVEVVIPQGGGGSGEKAWRLINTYTIESEDLAKLYFNTDMDGNPFELTEVYIVGDGRNASTHSGSAGVGVFFRFGDGTHGDTEQYNYESGLNSPGSTYQRGFIAQFEILNETIGRGHAQALGNMITYTDPRFSIVYPTINYKGKLDAVREIAIFPSGASVLYGVGTVVSIYGR